MFDAGLDGDFVDADSPVEFLFDAEGKTVQVNVGEIDSRECALEIVFIVGLACI